VSYFLLNVTHRSCPSLSTTQELQPQYFGGFSDEATGRTTEEICFDSITSRPDLEVMELPVQ
jgi:hypothetical protein